MKLLITISYWQGDYDFADKLANLIAANEAVKNQTADIALVARQDAPPLPASTVAALRAKFVEVHELKCERRAVGYPYAANEMWYWLASILAKASIRGVRWKDKYQGWLNLEPDCVPTKKNWIELVSKEWEMASNNKKLALGTVMVVDQVTPHLNGVAVYSMTVGLDLFGPHAAFSGPAHNPYDLEIAGKLLPKSQNTTGIKLKFKCATISKEQFDDEVEGGVYLLHGIKDESALDLARAELTGDTSKLVILNPEKNNKGVVFTYLDTVDSAGPLEQTNILNTFRQSWTLRGWQVRKMQASLASNHPFYKKYSAKVDTFPTISRALHRPSFLRWLALAELGGGLFAEHDVLNIKLSSAAYDTSKKTAEIVDGKDLSVVMLNKATLNEFVEYVIDGKFEHLYVLVNGANHVSDTAILREFLLSKEAEEVPFVAEWGSNNGNKIATDFPLIHFTAAGATKVRRSKYSLMSETLLSFK